MIKRSPWTTIYRFQSRREVRDNVVTFSSKQSGPWNPIANEITISSISPFPTYTLIEIGQILSQVSIYLRFSRVLRIIEHRERALSFVFVTIPKQPINILNEEESVEKGENLEVYLGDSIVNSQLSIDTFYTNLIINKPITILLTRVHLVMSWNFK